jgi:creatinine amidohydrolase/Fe(II)-dependent formamide hydrolase-like protein
VSEEAFAGMLDGIARSLRLAGFRFICLLADHGGSQRPQAAFAARLSAEWQRASIRVFGPERFDGAIAEQDAWLMRQGETRESIGTHAGIGDTAELPAVHPAGVDLARLPADRAAAVALGASGDPGRASAARGNACSPCASPPRSPRSGRRGDTDHPRCGDRPAPPC